MELSFHGAAGGVTGSCHLLSVHGKRILIDCGLFQGADDLNEENAADFGFDPRSVDYLLLTHAHLDHCGRIPLLMTQGFHGEIIPTGAPERAQDLLYFLRELIERRELPRSLSVFLDSPMAISATDVFRRHPEDFNPETHALFANHEDPFKLPGLHFTRDTAESKTINRIRGGAVIMAGSGMATGGRVLHHLVYNLSRKESSVVFVGYASAGTLARQIIDGKKAVRIYGEEIRVAARIYTIGGFSAHADQAELLDWHRGSGKPMTTFLVHGEDGGRVALAKLLREQELHVEEPTLHAQYTL